MKHMGQPVISHLKIVLLLDLYLERYSALMLIWISLWKKLVWEQLVLNEKCPQSKIQYTFDVFFALQKHTALISIWFFFLTGMSAVCFWRKMSKIKINYIIDFFFYALFLICFSKTQESHAYLVFFVVEKNRHESVVFLMKNVKNKKFT